MTEYIRAKIKDRDQFRQVFPLPRDSPDAPEVAKFILPIISETIGVKKMRSQTGSFYPPSQNTTGLPVDECQKHMLIATA